MLRMAESEDLRAFIREIMARYDKRDAEWRARMAALDAAEARRHSEAMAKISETREQNQQIYAEARAQREGLFRLLDRMDGRGDTPPA
jgi:hypothetical protein